MGDIVERLRKLWVEQDPKLTWDDMEAITEEAADEIEKLRAALVETLDYIDDPYDEFYIEIGQLLESIDAAALKETGDE